MKANTPLDVVIFGHGTFGSVVWYMLTHDSPYRVVGFTADRAYCTVQSVHGLPLIPFDALESAFPAGQVSLLIAVGGGDDVNRARSQRFLAGQARGYRFATYVSSRALVWPDLQVGEGSMVFAGANINPFAILGANCMVGSGSHISHHTRVGDHCYFAPHAAVAGRATIGQRCFVGVGSSVRDGVKLAPRCLVAAGAVVTADTLENGVYLGVPAKRQTRPAEAFEP